MAILDDSFLHNPKILGLSDRAFRLYVLSLVYCSAQLTDGFIDENGLHLLLATSKSRQKTPCGELITKRLWEQVDDHIFVHDFLKHNRSKERRERDRELSRQSSRRFRDTSQPSPGDRPSDASPGTSVTEEVVEVLPYEVKGSTNRSKPREARPRSFRPEAAHSAANNDPGRSYRCPCGATFNHEEDLYNHVVNCEDA